jgi:DnaJ domain
VLTDALSHIRGSPSHTVQVHRDPYRVLGVPHGASPAVVLDAYRRLSKLHHPDQGGSPERFVEIQRAYETLRARPTPDASLEERLAAMDVEVREAAARKPARDARADAVVRDVNDLVDGLDGLSSQLDGR